VLASDQIEAALRIEQRPSRAPLVLRGEECGGRDQGEVFGAGEMQGDGEGEGEGEEEEGEVGAEAEAAGEEESEGGGGEGEGGVGQRRDVQRGEGSSEGEEGGYGVDGNALGCMLPLFDMFEHRCGHPIGWEAGGGGVRFVSRVRVDGGEPLYNNYGPKGNGELLWTYGFAVPGNPLDSVEGIIVGR
ncbi:MAG: hypothetical protein SGPRY_003535, partial [Prymnesium sp.]